MMPSANCLRRPPDAVARISKSAAVPPASAVMSCPAYDLIHYRRAKVARQTGRLKITSATTTSDVIRECLDTSHSWRQLTRNFPTLIDSSRHLDVYRFITALRYLLNGWRVHCIRACLQRLHTLWNTDCTVRPMPSCMRTCYTV